jgi:hypothetical protein
VRADKDAKPHKECARGRLGFQLLENAPSGEWFAEVTPENKPT